MFSIFAKHDTHEITVLAVLKWGGGEWRDETPLDFLFVF